MKSNGKNESVMQQNNLSWQNLLLIIGLIIVLVLIMLIPLGMIRRQVDERSQNRSATLRDITGNWGGPQTFTGPWISYLYDNGKESANAGLYPDSLRYVVNCSSQQLHRSIYDVSVFTADLSIQGTFVLDARLASSHKAELILNLNELKGIQGNPSFVLDGKALSVRSGDKGIRAEIELPKGAKDGDTIPFSVTMRIKGSEALMFKPVGNLTEVEMTSDYPDPSFCGDFLPTEREVNADGFTAKWSISRITMASPSSNSFGVRMIMPVTQYLQTERATKYGILVILLVFIAGFVVEMVSRKPINIIQYLVIGASLVLFYSLLLAFSDFLSFGLSYLIASVMTVGALSGYFAGLVKSKWAFLLAGLTALAYGVIYVLLQMETFAFLAGTLLLFIILCVIMFLTRKLKLGDSGIGTGTTSE